MTTIFKNRIAELEKEVEALEVRMLEAFDSGSKNYNNLKNDQTKKINELKKLKLRLDEDNLLQK